MRVEGRWSTDFKRPIVFAYLERCERTPDSDIDVMVLLDNSQDSRVGKDRVWKLACDLTYQHDVSPEPIVLTEQEHQLGSTPLFFNVRREGTFMESEDQPTAVAGIFDIAYRQPISCILRISMMKSSPVLTTPCSMLPRQPFSPEVSSDPDT